PTRVQPRRVWDRARSRHATVISCAAPRSERYSSIFTRMMARLTKAPVVAVVIPVCGATGFLEDAVKSALSQTLRELAVTVIDDSNPDDPPILLDVTDPRLTLQRRSLNGGPGASRNDGWRQHPNAKYVAFLDADDLWDASKLRTQVEYLEAHEDCVAL